jgi:hypothetical protein
MRSPSLLIDSCSFSLHLRKEFPVVTCKLLSVTSANFPKLSSEAMEKHQEWMDASLTVVQSGKTTPWSKLKDKAANEWNLIKAQPGCICFDVFIEDLAYSVSWDSTNLKIVTGDRKLVMLVCAKHVM